MKVFLLLILALVPVVRPHQGFRSRIPNGYTVPNPGPEGGIWAGVGHQNAGGGGPLNPFGEDFRSADFQWTVALCKTDSDGDGRANGVELGDPDCRWSEHGESLPKFPAQSHPGIVDEPIQMTDSPCAHYSPPDDVVTQDIVFTVPNHIDEARTHYRCEQKEIEAPSSDLTYHQIKTEILLDNPRILHHMWIYICEQTNSSDGYKVGEGQYDCSGMEGNCQILTGWAVGASDWCEPPNVGARVKYPKSTGKLVMKIEAHYDNADHIAQTDQSGIRVHLTPTLRPLDNSMVILGMDYWDRQFKIPGNEEEFELVNICPSTATDLLKGPVWVYSWTPHMHLYGTKLLTEHYRCGEKIGQLGQIDDWDFNNQQSYVLPSPIKILPGDAIVTTCTFNTKGENATILGGESTTEEMCDNYLTYYPWAGTWSHPDLFTECVSFKRGLNPDYAGHHAYDYMSYAIMDISGEVYVNDWEEDPTKNIGACCKTNSCDEQYLSRKNGPCAIDSDCKQPAQCEEGLCVAV